jgi:glycosyltransferase involved in cell wall biosynthesis
MAEADTATIERLEKRLFKASDHVLYVNRALMERERMQCRNAEYLGHGVDFERFANARPLGQRKRQRPKALKGIKGPIVGFFGAMDDYRIDKGLMQSIARHIAPATLMLVGPAQMAMGEILKEPNVLWIGQVSHEELPGYAAVFDVGIIPFLHNEFNRQCNPVKLKEYLALGFPVVATRLPAYEEFKDVMYLADERNEFLTMLDVALTEVGTQMATARRARVERDSWDNQAVHVVRLLAGKPPV